MNPLDSLFWIFFGCLLGIFTGLVPGIHINTIAALALLFPRQGLGLALMIASMSIVHAFVDFIPSILFGAPEESTFLSVLPGHRMLLEGKGLLAVKLAASGAFFSGIIAVAFSPIFFLFIEKSIDFFPKIIPFALVFVLGSMLLGEKTPRKKFWGLIVLVLAALLGILVLGETGIVKSPLLVCVTGFFGAATIIESLRKKSFFPKQQLKAGRIKKALLFEGSLLGFLAGALVSIVPAIGSSQAAFILKKIFGNIQTKKFLVVVGGSNTANMFLGFVVLFAWGKTRSGSAVAISELIDLGMQNLVFIALACIIALGFGFWAAVRLAGFFIQQMHKINYRAINFGILGILLLLIAFLSNIWGFAAFFTATAIGLIAVSQGVKRTHCMAFLMIPALLFYLGF